MAKLHFIHKAKNQLNLTKVYRIAKLKYSNSWIINMNPKK